ncbi:Flo5p, partial [Saccharomyces cerevisiae x Saccharomyces kudriavzevii VIN7]
SASPSSTPTITHHVSSTVDAKYFTQTSSSFLESDDTVSSIQSSDTNSISTSGQSSSDFLSIPSSWLSTDITTSSSSDKRSLSTISTETSGIASSPFSSIYHISSSDNTSHTSTTMATIASSKSSKKITNRSSTRSTSLVSSGSVGQSSTQPEIPINISSTVTTNSVSHSDSYFLVQSTVNELNNDSTTTPTHSKAQKSASLIASLSTRTTTSAPQISDSQHLNNEASRLSTVSTSEPQVLPSSLPSFKSGDTNAELSTFASFTTVYKEWSGTFTHSYFTQVSRMYDNSAEMVKGEIKGPDGGIVVESIYYVETPTTYKAPTAVTMGSSAIFSARIDSDATEKKEETTMATITTCGSYLCTGTVSSAIISTVTTKIGDAVTKYTTWCPLSAAVSVEENTEIFLTSSALDNLSEPPSAVIKPTFTSTNDIARRPELTVDSYSRTDGSGTVVASKSIKTATSSGGIGGTSGHTTFSAKTHESAASSSSRVTSVISHESSASIPGLVIPIGNVPSFESPLTNVQSLITTSFTSGSHFQIYSSSSVPHSDRASLPLSTYAGTANNLLSNSAWSFLIALMWLVIS